MTTYAPVLIDGTQGELFLKRNPAIERLYKQGLRIGDKWYAEEQSYELKVEVIPAFSLLNLTYETVQEIYLLAASGFGRGAQARLRSAFEFTLVAAYIALDGDNAAKFMKFQHSEYAKELREAIRIHETRHKAEDVEPLRQALKKVEHRVVESKKEYPELGRSWHDGIRNIADRVKWEFHYFNNYLMPNRYVHASPLMVERKTSRKEDGSILNDGGPDYDAADEAVRSAFSVLGLSYAVATDIGIPIPMEDIQSFNGEVIKYYEDKPNKLRL